ncbi:MAG: heme A synthase [Burkholderiaceae bacterium]|nr:heme A synthase [Microbacteriaceae bacterium]
MKALLSPLRSLVAGLYSWLPVSVDRRVRVIVWVTLAVQILIVGTGGAVRLTGSGLGCPTWPRCTADSFVALPEQGIHGVIEFGNRLLTFVLVIVAILAFLFVVRLRRNRRDLFGLAIAIGAGIPAQAVLGGITVRTGLNPYVVGAHFIVSIVIVALSAIFVFRAYYGPRSRVRVVPVWVVATAHLASLFVALSIVMGVLTTGSGPHAGDANTPRNGLNSEVLQHLHSYPGYIAVGLTAVLVSAAIALRARRIRSFAVGLLAVEAVQVAVGIIQSRLGLPELLVGIHMVLACVVVAVMTALVLSLRSPVAAPVPAVAAERPVAAIR